jgi:hypothetical protein
MDYESLNHEERQMLRDLQAFRFRTRYAYRIPEGNDYQTMLVMTEQREQGLKPSTRVAIDTEGYELEARLYDGKVRR